MHAMIAIYKQLIHKCAWANFRCERSELSFYLLTHLEQHIASHCLCSGEGRMVQRGAMGQVSIMHLVQDMHVCNDLLAVLLFVRQDRVDVLPVCFEEVQVRKRIYMWLQHAKNQSARWQTDARHSVGPKICSIIQQQHKRAESTQR